MATTQGGIIGAGYSYILVFAKNLAGALIGSDSTEPTAGASTGNSGLRVEGAQTIPIGLADSEFVNPLGDDSSTVQFVFDEATLPNGMLELAARNLYLEAMSQGTTVYTIGNIITGVLAPQVSEPASLAMLMGRQAKTWKPGDRGNDKWELLFLPSITLLPKGNADWTQRTHGPYRFSISLSKGNLFAWGETFYDAALGTGAGALEPIEANYPYWTDIFKGDGVNLTFNLSKIPVLTDTAVVTVAGVVVSDVNYTLSVAPNLISFTGGNAPTAAALVDVFYPVERNNL